MFKRALSAVLSAGILMGGLGACAHSDGGEYLDMVTDDRGERLAVNYSASALGGAVPVSGEEMSEGFVAAAADLGFQLLNLTAEGNNSMVSPVSILYALGMTANGAAGETRTQMETVLFGGESTEAANRYFRAFSDSLPTDNGVSLTIANSIWLNSLRGDFSVNEEFLSTNASYYGAEIVGLPFGTDALGAINAWVSDKTDGMIPALLTDLDVNALTVLVNTVLFDGKWKEDYFDHAVFDATFTSADGTEAEREMLSSTEELYFRLGEGSGFIRPYAEKYSFVGILPDENIDVFAYAQTIRGADFVEAVREAEHTKVYVRIPSFTFDFSAELVEPLVQLGMIDAFDSTTADFSALGECAGENIFLSEVIHKTRIELSRTGTKAAAATAVMVEATSAMPTEEPKRIFLNRPFVFAIVENETGLPVFCGIVSELK